MDLKACNVALPSGKLTQIWQNISTHFFKYIHHLRYQWSLFHSYANLEGIQQQVISWFGSQNIIWGHSIFPYIVQTHRPYMCGHLQLWFLKWRFYSIFQGLYQSFTNLPTIYPRFFAPGLGKRPRQAREAAWALWRPLSPATPGAVLKMHGWVDIYIYISIWFWHYIKMCLG